MKKNLLYMIALVLTGTANSAFIYGQGDFRLEQLMGKTWVDYDDEDGLYSKYTYDCCIEKFVFVDNNGEDSPLETPFYLSAHPDTQFDASKVGNNQPGRYMIHKGNEGGSRNVHVHEILKLDNTEFITKSLFNGSIYTLKALDAYTLKYVLDNTPTSNLPFSIGKKTGFLDGYNDIPVNHAIVDRIYKNVQLTQFTNIAAQKRGKFLRRFSLSGGNSLVVVRFGSGSDITDVLCIVNSAGTVLNTLEATVTVDDMRVKGCNIVSSSMIYIYQVVPSSATSLPFENLTSFSGSVRTTIYSISGSSFGSGSVVNPGTTKTFTRNLLSDPDKEVNGY